MKTIQKLSLIMLAAMVLVLLMGIQNASAATCTGAACNGINPYGTTCWNDAYNAVVHYSTHIYNINKYSPSCVANWSYTRAYSYAWLGAGTYGGYTYYGDQPYLYVWNSMVDGTHTVCTRGYWGPYKGYYPEYTSWACA